MDAPLFAGVGVALVTLFDDGGALDARGHRRYWPPRWPTRA